MLATRPLTLRLALPRQMTDGDTILVSGTVNNRTSEPATVHVRLTGDLDTFNLTGPAEQTVAVPANGQTVVPWMVHVDSKHPAGGSATFQAEAIADRGGQDMTDALRMRVPV